MTTERKLAARTQWAIAIVVIAVAVLATLIVANTINHAGWNPWVVTLGCATVVGLGTVLIKLRGSTGLNAKPMGPMGGQGGSHPGDGMHAGDGG
ncbi:MAG TPA: hypothetical protein VH969_12455 [Actinophytocola sp.]|jgi:hypothetical protein|uniref:hypothetical protein n=1 Tax=Actinophytocola sp. TaxID=1872138 RepID=UPI002F93E043